MKILLSPSAADPNGVFAAFEFKLSSDIPERVDGALDEKYSLSFWELLAFARDATPEDIAAQVEQLNMAPQRKPVEVTDNAPTGV